MVPRTIMLEVVNERILVARLLQVRDVRRVLPFAAELIAEVFLTQSRWFLLIQYPENRIHDDGSLLLLQKPMRLNVQQYTWESFSLHNSVVLRTVSKLSVLATAKIDASQRALAHAGRSFSSYNDSLKVRRLQWMRPSRPRTCRSAMSAAFTFCGRTNSGSFSR